LEKPATPAAPGGADAPALRPRPGAPVGVLWAHAEPSRFRHARYLPAPDLAAHVEHVWVVRWDLRGRPPFRQETLPHPSVHLVVEAGHSGLAGVPYGRFTKVLDGRGRAVGVKFRPGGFRALWPQPVHTLTGRVRSLGDAFGTEGAALEGAVLACGDAEVGADAAGADRWPDAAGVDVALVTHLDAFVRDRLAVAPGGPAARGALADAAALVAFLMERITRDRAVGTVEALARAGGVSARTVQRLFRDHVGVSAKWVLCRQRLHDAATQLASGPPGTRGDAWARLALDLGFFDQAHFVRSFTALVGVSPAAYARLYARQLRAAPGEE
jgi:AraC-like DNA-binding protein